MLIHSWNPSTQQVLCTQCIEDANKGKLKREVGDGGFVVIPSVAQEIRKRILAMRELVKLRRL